MLGARPHMEVIYNSYTMCTRGLPDIYTLSPRDSGVYIRQTTRAHGITTKCNIFTPHIKGIHKYT